MRWESRSYWGIRYRRVEARGSDGKRGDQTELAEFSEEFANAVGDREDSQGGSNRGCPRDCGDCAGSQSQVALSSGARCQDSAGDETASALEVAGEDDCEVSEDRSERLTTEEHRG